MNTKIAVLSDLTLSRVRFARLFDRLTTAVNAVDGVWLRSLQLAPDGSPSHYPNKAGKRFMMSLAGYAVGANSVDRDHKMTELLRSLEKTFQVPPETSALPNPLPDDYGFGQIRRPALRSRRARWCSRGSAARPGLQGVDPRIQKQINAPSRWDWISS